MSLIEMQKHLPVLISSQLFIAALLFWLGDLYVTAAPLSENMWSEYGPQGMLVENRRVPSFGGSDPSQDIYMPYVVNDITSFFTLLVGIYFPSVTGKTAAHTRLLHKTP